MKSLVTAAFVWVVWVAPCGGQYVGSRVCQGCHPKQFASQSAAGHARSLRQAEQHPLVDRFVSDAWIDRGPRFRLRFVKADGKLRAQGYDSENSMDIPVEWAFGAGDQAVTFVTRINEDWYLEHHNTYYSAIGKMAATAGHAELAPKTLPEAMGLPYKTTDPQTGILGCFQCHSTGGVQVSADRVLEPAELGVRCESCHGAGTLHVAAARKGETARLRQVIGNPKRLSAVELNEFCGRCHRPPASEGVRIDWNYAWNVRHQPVYMSQSRCFVKSAGKLSCLTCHEPHSALQKGTAAYNQKCAGCHGKPRKCGTAERTNCVDCHMPAVSPQPPLRFTNHWIGVYGEGGKLRPVGRE